jgi:hypothetical protein
MAWTTSAVAQDGGLGAIQPYLETEESDHFAFHYVRRSQYVPFLRDLARPPIRFHGVHSTEHVARFGTALEKSWDRYAEMGWKAVQEGMKGKIDVYFLWMPGIDGRTWIRPVRIDLPARHEDVHGPTNSARVEATASHELFHVLQGTVRKECFDNRDAWAWFAEATAAFMECQVFPQNQEHLCYLYRWFDEPEASLELGPTGHREYGSLMFCRFLRDRFPQNDIVNGVWISHAQLPSPIEAIQTYLGSVSRVPLASSVDNDLFANEFLVWNFVLKSRRCGYYESLLLKEKFQHAFAEPVLRIPNGQDYTIDFDELGPLAGRYHLVEVPKGAGSCRIEVELLSSGSATSPGKGIVHAISQNGEPVFQSEQVTLSGASGRFCGHFAAPPAWLGGTVRALLLIMANVSCGHDQMYIDSYTLKLHS